MAWSRIKIPDFDVSFTYKSSTLDHDLREYVFSLHHAKTIPLGAVNSYLSGQAAVERVSVIEGLNFLSQLFVFRPKLYLKPKGRVFFLEPDNQALSIPNENGRQLEFRTGLFQAVHFGGISRSLTLNVDIAAGTFVSLNPADTVLQVAARFLNRAIQSHPNCMNINNLTQADIELLNRELAGIKYTFLSPMDRHTRRKHHLRSFVHQSAARETFTNDKGRTLSIAKHIQEKYDRTLRYPDAALIETGSSCFHPMELCYVVPVLVFLLPILITGPALQWCTLKSETSSLHQLWNKGINPSLRC